MGGAAASPLDPPLDFGIKLSVDSRIHLRFNAEFGRVGLRGLRVYPGHTDRRTHRQFCNYVYDEIRL